MTECTFTTLKYRCKILRRCVSVKISCFKRLSVRELFLKKDLIWLFLCQWFSNSEFRIIWVGSWIVVILIALQTNFLLVPLSMFKIYICCLCFFCLLNSYQRFIKILFWNFKFSHWWEFVQCFWSVFSVISIRKNRSLSKCPVILLLLHKNRKINFRLFSVGRTLFTEILVIEVIFNFRTLYLDFTILALRSFKRAVLFFRILQVRDVVIFMQTLLILLIWKNKFFLWICSLFCFILNFISFLGSILRDHIDLISECLNILDLWIFKILNVFFD